MLSPLEREKLSQFAENMELRSAVLKLLLHEVTEHQSIRPIESDMSNERLGEVMRARMEAEIVIHNVMSKIDNYKKRIESKDKKNEAY